MSAPRRHAVLICFVCEPGAGSEEGVGWEWTKAAAERADVTVLTRPEAAGPIRDAVAELKLPIAVQEVDMDPRLHRLFPRKLVFLYYVAWQILAGRAVRRIERTRRVDVVHHITWASDSLPSALLASKAPVRIWGPVGGSTTTARGLYRYLSPRGRVDQAFRDVVNGGLRAAFGRRVARHATLIGALNHDVARQFASVGTPVVLQGNLALQPHELEATAAASDADTEAMLPGVPPAAPGVRTALFAARLIPWKGLLLAVQAMAHLPDWRLVVTGDGPERERAEALAASLGVADRVFYAGRIPRPQLLAAFTHVDALLMPSFHDSAPWSVGEASALGCPVVCLDAGGPQLMAGPNARVVQIGSGDRLPERIAEALAGITGRGPHDDRWAADRLPDLLEEWYRAPDATPPDRAEEAVR